MSTMKFEYRDGRNGNLIDSGCYYNWRDAMLHGKVLAEKDEERHVKVTLLRGKSTLTIGVEEYFDWLRQGRGE